MTEYILLDLAYLIIQVIATASVLLTICFAFSQRQHWAKSTKKEQPYLPSEERVLTTELSLLAVCTVINVIIVAGHIYHIGPVKGLPIAPSLCFIFGLTWLFTQTVFDLRNTINRLNAQYHKEST